MSSFLIPGEYVLSLERLALPCFATWNCDSLIWMSPCAGIPSRRPNTGRDIPVWTMASLIMCYSCFLSCHLRWACCWPSSLSLAPPFGNGPVAVHHFLILGCFLYFLGSSDTFCALWWALASLKVHSSKQRDPIFVFRHLRASTLALWNPRCCLFVATFAISFQVGQCWVLEFAVLTVTNSTVT